MMHRIRELQNSLNNVVRRGRTSAPSVETGIAQVLQVARSAFESAGNFESWLHYGFMSVPLAGCDVAVVNLGGDQSTGIVIASNDVRTRPQNMLAGEVQIYDNASQHLYLQNGQKIVINAQTEIDFNINGTLVGKFTSTGLSITGTINATGDGIFNNISVDNHTHPYSPGSGATTQTGKGTG